MINRHTLVLLLMLLAGLALNLVTVYTWAPAFIANDAVQYLSTAENWLAGNGFSTNALIYTPHFQGVLPATQTVWPTGFPLAIALVSKFGVDLKTGLLILNLVMHATASLLMWLVLLRMGVERFFAAICTFLFYAMALPWAYVSAGLTEPLFTTLLMASLFLLPNPKNGKLISWLACGLLIALCIFIRFSAVFVAFGAGAGIFIYLITYERRTITALIAPLSKLTLLVALPTLAFAYLMIRTYNTIGTLDRYSGLKLPETLLSTAKRWVSKSSELTGFAYVDPANSWIATFGFVTFTLLICGVIVLFLLVVFKQRQRSLEKPTNLHRTETQTSYFRVFWLVTISHGLVLIIYLSISSMSTTPLEIITRYLYQIYPAFYVLFCFMLSTLFRSGRRQALTKVLTSLLIMFYLAAQINSLRVTRPVFFRDAKITVELMALPVHGSANIESYMERCFANRMTGKSIWSPHGQSIHLHTGIPTISQVPNYTVKPFNADEFRSRVDQYQIGMFVFINFLDYPNENHEAYLDSAKSWLLENDYQRVDLQSSEFGLGRTVEIYTADPQCDIHTTSDLRSI